MSFRCRSIRWRPDAALSPDWHASRVAKWIEYPNAIDHLACIHGFAVELAAASGLRAGEHDCIVKRDTTGLLQVQSCADDGRGDLNDFKLLVQIQLRPKVLG